MKTMLKRCILLTAALVLAAGLLVAQGVDTSELESVVKNPDSISFINYSGPHSVISTAAQIRGIGSELAEPVSSDRGAFQQIGESDRYQIIHVVTPSEKGKLDADILILGSNAGVDHIKNLRRIIAGFLSSAYGYSTQDADTLAVFITVYNAVNRGNIGTYTAKYKSSVLQYLTADACGLSVNWQDWAGNSQIVIPLLSAVDGGLSTIDTTVISGREVVTSLRDESDRGVEERKNLVDLKEREASQAFDEAKNAQKEAVVSAEEARQAEAEAENVKKALVEAREEQRIAMEKAEETADKAAAYPDDEQAQKDAAEAREKALMADAEVESKEAEYDAAVAKAEKAREYSEQQSQEAAEKQKFSDRKNAETQQERISIAQDQQKNIDETAAARKIVTTYALLYNESERTSSLVILNAGNGQMLKTSPVTTIRSRRIYPVEGGFIAIAGKNSGTSDKNNQAVKLVIIDEDTMEIISQSHEILCEESDLVEYKGMYYGVMTDGKKNYAACWDQNLALVSQSLVEVQEKTPLIITGLGLAVTTSKGSIALLTVDTLDEIK